MPITFITGNQSKADYLAKYLGLPVEHVKVGLDEIQSMDLKEIVGHKVRQAYDKIKTPVIVEDVSLEFEALGGLPGPFIKFFIERMSFDTVCQLLEHKSRKATARCVFGYYDGETLQLFEGAMEGEVAQAPVGDGGYGWDKIFIPNGYTVTRAQMGEDEYEKTYVQIKPFAALKDFLSSKV